LVRKKCFLVRKKCFLVREKSFWLRKDFVSEHVLSSETAEGTDGKDLIVPDLGVGERGRARFFGKTLGLRNGSATPMRGKSRTCPRPSILLNRRSKTAEDRKPRAGKSKHFRVLGFFT
jgi:hypothetical protein